MNSQLIQQGRAAYRAGDFSAAAQMLGAAKTPDEIMGEADHLRGNALMHLGMYAEAAEAYAAALNDGTYGKRGALLTNRGKALAAVGDYTTAAQAFSAATQDASYATPFKAYLGLGNALFQSGDYANAGTAFRQAAIDGANPAPAAALGELGRCFIKLGRPADAVETYRTAVCPDGYGHGSGARDGRSCRRSARSYGRDRSVYARSLGHRLLYVVRVRDGPAGPSGP